MRIYRRQKHICTMQIRHGSLFIHWMKQVGSPARFRSRFQASPRHASGADFRPVPDTLLEQISGRSPARCRDGFPVGPRHASGTHFSQNSGMLPVSPGTENAPPGAVRPLPGGASSHSFSAARRSSPTFTTSPAPIVMSRSPSPTCAAANSSIFSKEGR